MLRKYNPLETQNLMVTAQQRIGNNAPSLTVIQTKILQQYGRLTIILYVTMKRVENSATSSGTNKGGGSSVDAC